MKARQLYEVIIYHLNYVLRLIIGRRKMDFTKYTKPFAYLANVKVPYKNDNSMRIYNNKWGIFKLERKGKEDQYIQGINDHQWSFNTPNKNHGVLGYPNILIFETLGQATKAALSGARLTYDITLDLERYKKYNLAIDLWIQTTPTYNLAKTVNEIMIWEDYFVAKPAGKKIGKIYHFGSWYSIYHGWIDKSHEPNAQIDGWFLTTFVRHNRQTKGHLNISDFLAYLIAEDIVNREHYVNSVEFGTEVYNAKGVVTINFIAMTARKFD